MKPGDRVEFTWQPTEPVEAFECMLVTAGEPIGARSFAVTVSATDALGDEVSPQGTAWRLSNALGAHFQYSRESTPTVGSRLHPWVGTAIAQKFVIGAVGWPPEGDDVPDIIALGVSAVHADPTAPRVWTLLAPSETKDAH